LFVLTASKGAVPEDAIAKIKSIMDGVIELTLVRHGRKALRYLSILKMERRRIAVDTAQFDIARGRGLVFHVSRVGVLHKKLVKVDLKKLLPLLKKERPSPPTTAKSETKAEPKSEAKPETERTDERTRKSERSETQSKPSVTKPR
jgi:ribosomal protein L12E/L44/L45/RPP1/RPP2